MSKFEKAQRVNIPGVVGTQGVIIDVTESITGFPIYAMRWLTDAGETMTGSCGEGDLHNANRPFWVEVGALPPASPAELAKSLRKIMLKRKTRNKASRKAKR